MQKVTQNKNPQFKVKSSFLYLLLIIFPTLIVMSGCSAPRRKVIAEWQGNVINEEKLNVHKNCSGVILDNIKWEISRGTLIVKLEEECTERFDVHKEYEKVQAVRRLTDGEAKIIGIAVGEAPFTRIGATVELWGIPMFMEIDKRNKKTRKRVIEELQAGSDSVKGEFWDCPSFKPVVIATPTYFREVLDVTYEEVLTDQSMIAMVPIIDTSVKLVCSLGKELIVKTDIRGIAEFSLADSYCDSLKLLPDIYDISVQYERQWQEISRVELTGDLVAQIIENMKKESVLAEGIPSLPPFAKLTIKIPGGEVKADTDCQLSLTVKNTGKGEFYQLVATSESLVPELEGLKFEFGKLEPGDSLTLTKKVHIPRGQSTGPANVNFKWSELNGYEPNPMHARIMVKGLPRPQFAVSVQVLDDNTGNSVGNGDGRIQKGEAVDLLVTVKNIGDGAARDVKVKIDDISARAVIVNISEQSLGEITPGQSKQARLTITTKKSAKIDKLTPTIKVIDQYLNIEQKEQLALALESELAPSIMAYKTTIYVGEEEVAIRGGAGDETAIIARAKPGSSLQATGELGQWIRVELPKIGVGWIHRSMIAFEPTVQPVAATQVSGSIIEILQKAPPLIAVAKPLGNSKFKSSHVEVSGVIADDQAVSRTEFKLNGREITFDDKRAIGIEAGNQAGAQREVNFAFPVELMLGENEIEIVAWDNEGLKSSKVISVSYEKEKGNIYIACIGIDKYKNIPRLKYAAADARTMAQSLQKSLSVPDENMYVLLNEQATLTNIKNTLGVKIRQRANKSDMVIIYFSGHGAPEADPYSPDADGVNKYLLPIEAERDALYATALPMDEVRNIFRRLISERVIFLADTCYSGAAGGRTLMLSGTQYRSVNQDNLLARLRDTGKGRVILTASQGSEVSQEMDKLGHGVFTYYLLRGLDGKADRNGDHTITISELYEYVSKEVPRETKNTQHPMMKLDEMVGEVVISVLGRK